MMTARILFAPLALAATLVASGAFAQSLVVGLATDWDTGGLGGVVEYHGAPLLERGRFDGGLAVAARLDADGDAWIGVGVSGTLGIGRNGFIEASFMPGYYDLGETELFGNVQFRSLIGIGLELPSGNAVSLSIDHLSNAGLESRNPGSEAVTLRYRLNF